MSKLAWKHYNGAFESCPIEMKRLSMQPVVLQIWTDEDDYLLGFAYMDHDGKRCYEDLGGYDNLTEVFREADEWYEEIQRKEEKNG